MADESPTDYFVELVSSVSHANGVFRITMGEQVDQGSARSTLRLLIPANQLQAVLRGIADGANEIREKLKAQAEEGGEAAEPEEKTTAAAKKKK